MCRNIQTLFNFEPPATEDEVRAASQQYVRKISVTKPSQANEPAFERAVDEVTVASMRLLDALVTNAAPATARSRRRVAGHGPRSASPLPERTLRDLDGSFDGEIVRPGDLATTPPGSSGTGSSTDTRR